jgi:hypothetical protein
MKRIKNVFDYAKIIKTLTFFAVVVLLNKLSSTVEPFSTAVLSVVVANSPSPYFY